MAKWIWSTNPLAVSRLGTGAAPCPLSRDELLRLGIPARKISRVQSELARLFAANAVDFSVLPALARQISDQLC